MRKKGFTLIELLAVIVLLAIVMLVSSPIVLNIINNSKNKATLRSAEMYVKALENSLGNIMLDEIQIEDGTYSIMKDGNLCLELNNDSCTKGLLKVEISGEVPNSGTVTLEKGQVKDITLELNNKTITQNNEGKLDYQTKDDSNIVFDGDITFTYNEEAGMSLPSICLDQTKFKDKANYKITLSDINGSEKTYDVISFSEKIEDFGDFMLVDKYKFTYMQYVEDNLCFLGSMDGSLELNGEYSVKIEQLNSDVYPHLLRIKTDGLEIFSTELEIGSAIVEIKDGSGNTTNLNTTVESDVTLKLIDIYDYTTFKPYYELLEKGETITVTVKQGDNTYVLGDSKFTYEDDYLCSGDLYYWGNNKLGYLFGC